MTTREGVTVKRHSIAFQMEAGQWASLDSDQEESVKVGIGLL